MHIKKAQFFLLRALQSLRYYDFLNLPLHQEYPYINYFTFYTHVSNYQIGQIKSNLSSYPFNVENYLKL